MTITAVEGFDTVLVANRGEIARRIIRTLRALGIRSVAVYSDADAAAPHVREADTAVHLGPAPAAASYLNTDAVLDAARLTGAQAVHPGYGFLSENAAFARACTAAGLVFIGPAERALEVMGDKIRAKAHVAAHGVPVVPGFAATGMTDDDIVAAATETGFPLLVKPSAGGGGKGMQVVRSAAELPEALRTARRVAGAAFGDDTLLLERLIERPRHIEVQVLADAHGAIIHLGERECTLQRRHQKVIEEAPSPVIDAATRARLGAAACAAAASVDYRGAGTVEFLVAGDRPDDFFFIEMNTRLQVEHPVTEAVTGIDLVEQQLRIAAGAPLAIGQDEVRLEGHAIEARVYAESPARGFLPATGEVLKWLPAPGVRTDAAVEAGSVITADYDPMIAKVIAHGADRAAALEQLDTALERTVALGVDTNITFLRDLLSDPAVRAGDLDTGLIDRAPAPEPAPPPASVLHAAAAWVRSRIGHETPWQSTGLTADAASHPAGSPWRRLSGWRVGGQTEPARVLLRSDDGVLHRIEVAATAVVPATEESHAMPIALDADGTVWVHADGRAWRLQPVARRIAMQQRHAAVDRAAGAAEPELRAPMPGTVVAVHVADGSVVAAGDRVVTIEAMKMEHAVVAPHGGVVRLDVAVAAQVRRDQVLAHVAAEPAASEPS